MVENGQDFNDPANISIVIEPEFSFIEGNEINLAER